MLKSNIIFTLLSFSIAFSQYDYTLEDINFSSNSFGEEVGTSYFSGKVSLHYFGHYN